MNRNIIIGCLGGLLLASGVWFIHTHRRDKERINELESQVVVLQRQGQNSELDRSVSEQMEQIAHGQQALSEERSQEAIRQSAIAQAATLRSEAERRKALKAQAAAEISAAEALESYKMAEHQRQNAEYARMVADTLNYISLGRTLGSQSYSIYQTGNTVLGNMLAYASYLYTHDYGGNLYSPTVFQAMTQSAGGRNSWSIHNGSISRLVISPKDGRLLTVSTFGEIFSHQINGEQMHTNRLMSDKQYWFSDLYAAPSGKVYALSYTGHLVIIDGNQSRVVMVENVKKPLGLQILNEGRSLLIVGENSAALFDIATEKILVTRHLDFHVTSTGRLGQTPILFDRHGRMHLVNGLEKITTEKVPVTGVVTAYACSRKDHLTAYGMADGTIWLTDGSGKTYQLVEHLSRVTKLEFIGRRLYSSSYDGKMLFWPIESNSQINAVTLYQSAHWLNDFTFSSNKDYIMMGEHNGTVTQSLISLPKIAQRLRQNVRRNFTQDEWNYYVGKGIPYRKIKE